MLQNKQIKTKAEFFNAIHNGYSVYVDVEGKIIAFSYSMYKESQKELHLSKDISFIQKVFGRFFSEIFNSILISKYSEEVKMFFRTYLTTHTFFTWEAIDDLNRVLRTAIIMMTSEYLIQIYYALPKTDYSLEDVEIFCRELCSLPYNKLAELSQKEMLSKELLLYLPQVGSSSIVDCIGVIKYLVQETTAVFHYIKSNDTVQSQHGSDSFILKEDIKPLQKNTTPIIQNVEYGINPSSSSENSTSYGHTIDPAVHSPVAENISSLPSSSSENSISYEHTVDPVVHSSVAENISSLPSSSSENSISYEHTVDPAVHSPVAKNISSLPSSSSENSISYEHTVDPVVHSSVAENISSLPPSSSENSISYEHTVDPAVHSSAEENIYSLPLETEDILEKESVDPEQERMDYGVLDPNSSHFSEGDEEVAPEETSLYPSELKDTNEGMENTLESTEFPQYIAPNEEENIYNIPFEEEYMGDEIEYLKDDEEIEANKGITVAGKDVDSSTAKAPDTMEGTPLLSYYEFQKGIFNLEEFILGHEKDFVKLNQLFMAEMHDLLSFIAQYHHYHLNRQKTRFELLHHATEVYAVYENMQHTFTETKSMVLLSIAQYSFAELKNIHKDSISLNNLLTILSLASLSDQTFYALYLEEYEFALLAMAYINANNLKEHTINIDINEILISLNIISALSLLQEIDNEIYSANFFKEYSESSLEEIQASSAYYRIYHYQLILEHKMPELKDYIPQRERNSHTFFEILSITEKLYSSNFGTEEGLAEFMHVVDTCLRTTYEEYEQDTSHNFIQLYKEVLNNLVNSEE